jgi:hypothetical protein
LSYSMAFSAAVQVIIGGLYELSNLIICFPLSLAPQGTGGGRSVA